MTESESHIVYFRL